MAGYGAGQGCSMGPLHPWGAEKVLLGLEGKAGGVAVVTGFVQPGGD